MESYKQMMDLLNAELVLICKQKKTDGNDLEKAKDLLMRGCDVNFNGSKPMYFAVKNYNFALVSLLIKFGALDIRTDSAVKTKDVYIEENGQARDSRREGALSDCDQIPDLAAQVALGGEAYPEASIGHFVDKTQRPDDEFMLIQESSEVLIQLKAKSPAEVSRKFLASMCEKGEFSKKKEESFWQLIDEAIKRTGFDEIYLAPYINMVLLQGRVDKLCRMAEKYKISLKEAMRHVKIMVIFEVIELAKEESLYLINEYLDWQKVGLDTAVTKGRIKATEYILFKNREITPAKDSIIKAILAGNVDMLELLNLYGIELFDEEYVKAAVKGFSFSPLPLKFLSQKGATFIGYDGKSLYENAVNTGDKKLIDFVKTLNVIQK